MTPDQRAAFLDSLAAGVDMPRAMRHAGIRDRALKVAREADPELDLACLAAERRALPSGWAAAVAASERATVAEPPAPATDPPAEPGALRISAGDDFTEGFDRVRAEARDLFRGEDDPHFRFLLWINHRRQMAGMHALDPLWLDGFRAFYASGKPIMVARKGLRAGGSVSACCALTNDSLDNKFSVDQGTTIVIPIMSSSRDEATDRFTTIRAVLHACGVAPKKKKGEEEDGSAIVLPGGLGKTYQSRRSLSGGGIISLEDVHPHALEFRILPAMRRSAVGYTGGGFFLDETDLWPADAEMHVNPADVVIEDVLKRITTQPTARGYIFSASYYAESAHSRRVDMGDTSAQFLMRLGERGAAVDLESRHRLAAKIGSADPRLVAGASDPMSPDLPAWVFNPTQAPIERCYQLSDDKLGPMLGLYGGRATENAGAGIDGLAGAKLTTARAPAREALADVVIGVAPSGDGAPEWGIVVAGIGETFLALADSSMVAPAGQVAALLSVLSAGHRASVLCVAREHEARLRAELAAGLSGLASYAPPVWAADIYDGKTLRTGPLRSLLDAERLRIAVGLTGLSRAIAGHRPAARSARVEALACAVARLVACYPWAGIAQPEAVRGPVAYGDMIAPRAGIQFTARVAR